MPASALRPAPATTAGRPAGRAWVEVHPDFADRLAGATATDLLDLPGEIVSGHADRHVVRVELPGWERALYLKRQHRVTWRERLRQWRAGFGWRSRCGRETALVMQLATAGLPAPRWVAHGEDGRGRAFLLVEELTGAAELRRRLGDKRVSRTDRARMADRLGREVAAVHAAGFDTPDLTAKHVFVGPTGTVTLIDWQSARRLAVVPAAARLRTLAAFHASLADHLATPRDRLRFLRAYLGTRAAPAAREVERLAVAARKRRSVRDQRQPVVSGTNQRLVWLAGEAVCAVPNVATDWPTPAVCPPFYGSAVGTHPFALPDGRAAELVTGTTVAPLGRLAAWLRGRPWRSPGATLGRVLFHLDRYGIPAPQLFAFGQRETGAATAEWFALYEPPAGRPLADWQSTNPPNDRREDVFDQCHRLLTELHDAGCRPAGPVFWVDDDDRVSVGGVRSIRIVRRVSARDRHRDAALLFGGRC